MAVDTALPALLTTLTQSLTSALESCPSESSILPPVNGISLLDIKNDLLLSYLQNLVFLILLKLRNRTISPDDNQNGIDNEVVKKLVEMRIYLDKGVRPLEGRLKYQIDKVLRAADDSIKPSMPPLKASKGVSAQTAEDSDASEDDGDNVPASGNALKASEINDLQYRPNPMSLVRPKTSALETEERAAQDGVYKPPRITATAMPTTTGRPEKEARRSNKSATLDEFISTEFSTAPMAEPSIGSTIISGGRRSKSEKERKEDAERKDYEEKNYVRLPKLSKKDKAKKAGTRDAGYGGEEWRGIGDGIDRIERLTKRQGGEGRSALDKSRKRATEDGPKSSGGGEEVGQRFQKRAKIFDGGKRDRTKR